MMLLVIVEFVLVLGPPKSHPKYNILSERGIMGGFRHLMVSVQHHSRCYLVVVIIHIMLHVIIHLVLHLVLVKVMWFLIPLTFPPMKMIFLLMVVIFCHLGVRIVQKWLIQTKTSYLIHYLRGIMMILLFLALVEVVLVLG